MSLKFYVFHCNGKFKGIHWNNFAERPSVVTIQLVIQRCWLSVICVKSRFIPLIFSAVCKQEHTCALYGHSIDSVDLDHQLDTWPFGVIARGTVVWFPSARMLLYICYVNIFDLCRYYTRWKVMSC